MNLEFYSILIYKRLNNQYKNSPLNRISTIKWLFIYNKTKKVES